MNAILESDCVSKRNYSIIDYVKKMSIFTRLRFEVEAIENGGSLSDRGKSAERSMEDLTKSSSSHQSHGMTRAARALTVR